LNVWIEPESMESTLDLMMRTLKPETASPDQNKPLFSNSPIHSADSSPRPNPVCTLQHALNHWIVNWNVNSFDLYRSDRIQSV
jgi:hypothetical protein